MKTILCVADAPAGAEKAISSITEQVQLHNTRIILFHNIHTRFEILKGGPSHLQLIEELEERNEYLELMEALTGRLKQQNPEAGISYEIEIRHGLLQETVPALVLKKQVDLVLLCNQETHPQALLSEIRDKSGCPVLVVPPQSVRSTETNTAFAAMLQHELLAETVS
ncbi:universal stress protein [Botryobacter ruber]|uniref:universal stress protein n=1 Tax=Botryobacter ruber TaxID=2171629 RepID=UPI000E0B836E|nr:universal stress protein [Botryobacter ruber]